MFQFNYTFKCIVNHYFTTSLHFCQNLVCKKEEKVLKLTSSCIITDHDEGEPYEFLAGSS